MPAYTLNTSRVSPNRSVRTSKIRRIVIHHWNDPSTPGTLAGTVNHLCSRASKVSAHYVVSGRQVFRLVPESVVAWHAKGGNSDSIGIECDPRQQDSTYETVAQLIREIRGRHGDLPLVRHRDVHGSLTACPGTYDLARLDRLARGTTTAPAPKPSPTPSGRLAVDGRLGRDTVRALQRWLVSKGQRVLVDGKAGHGTWRALQAVLGTPIDGYVSHQSHAARSLGNGITQGWRHTGPRSKGSTMVRALQRRLRITADGVWGEDTTRALQAALNAGTL